MGVRYDRTAYSKTPGEGVEEDGSTAAEMMRLLSSHSEQLQQGRAEQALVALYNECKV